MANRFDDFSKNLAVRSSKHGSLMSMGANMIGAAVATLSRKPVESKYADACAGYTGEDYDACVEAAELRDRIAGDFGTASGDGAAQQSYSMLTAPAEV